MRGVLPYVLIVALAGCSQPETHWDKAGADPKTTTDDLVTCKRAAQDEAFRLSPPVFVLPYAGIYRRIYWGDDRFYTEVRLTDFCMRNKGYTLVTSSPPKTTSPSAPEATDK
jgi:hypothetical protein